LTSFVEIPEALDFIAGQSWLAPDEPSRAATHKHRRYVSQAAPKLGWHEALRQIAAIMRRIDLHR
jgi:hypothetical protein